MINVDGEFLAWENGPRQGVHLLLNIEADEHTFSSLLSGVRIAVHDQGTLPIMDIDGFDLSPGISASVGVRAVSSIA